MPGESGVLAGRLIGATVLGRRGLGSYHRHRTAAGHAEVAKESFDPEAVMRWPQQNRPELSTTSQLGESSIDHAVQVEEAAHRLEATYRKRRPWWNVKKKEWLVKVAR